MANSSINLIDLDFNSFKSSLKTHLSSQSKFQDYDFDGSNISVLLDVLAYNTYLNTFYMNMVASEMFLDTAQIRDSVVSHAKELNYLPRSFRSATATVDISITPSTSVTSVVIPRGTGFTGRLGSNTFNFVVDSDIAITSSNNGVFYSNNTTIYEGSEVVDVFVKNDSITNQRFLLNNPNIDTSSISVSVTENGGANTYSYIQQYYLYGLTSTSLAFFVQPAENNLYELIFGDNFTGRTPRNGSIIEVTYRVCNGELPNGIDTFVNNSSIDGHSNISITTVTSAVSGSVSESIESIKFNAPRSYQTQERAVTENDYKILLLREFPEIQSVSVYGGEKANPPQYGKVFIVLDIENSDVIPDANKNRYSRYISDKAPLSTIVEFVEPSYIYLSINCLAKYNFTITDLSESQLKTIISSAIVEYGNQNLNDFNVNFRYSNFLAAIDSSHLSILNNDTLVNPYIKISPKIGVDTSFSISFDTKILITTPSTTSHNIVDERGLFSSPFTFRNQNCQLEDDGIGNVRIVKVTETSHVTLLNVGSVDYNTGVVSINNLNIDQYIGDSIKIFIKPVNRDFNVIKQNIMKINLEDIVVTMVPLSK